MNDELDKHLREALRPVDPGDQFADGVLLRVANEAASRRRHVPLQWRWAAVLAFVTLGAAGLHGWQVRRTQGLEARRQLIEALQVTGEKLELANRALNSSAGSRADPGA